MINNNQILSDYDMQITIRYFKREAYYCIFVLLFSHGSETVSYTHLDVYKRQTRPCVPDNCFSNPVTVIIEVSGSIICSQIIGSILLSILAEVLLFQKNLLAEFIDHRASISSFSDVSVIRVCHLFFSQPSIDPITFRY